MEHIEKLEVQANSLRKDLEKLQKQELECRFKRCSIKGSMHNSRSDLVEALDLVARGKVKPIIETYPLAQINEAFERVASG